MWLRFIRPFDFDPPAFGGRATVAFPAGHVGRVTRDCAAAALAAGAAFEVTPPRSQIAKGKDNASPVE